ncbi:MAG: translocation/assembly module TamB domain-containing protein [Bdellovibrionota bacterium]
MSKRLLRICLLTLVIAGLTVQFAANIALGLILKEVFAIGTDCEVQLRNPRVYFYPLSASVTDALIRHRTEPLDHGFRAKKISIRLDFWRLLHKEIRLDNLILDGASVNSVGTDTGFINTMAFLFPPKKEPPPNPAPPTKIEQWLKSWAFHVTTITIRSDRKPDRLRIGFHGENFVWDFVKFQFNEQDYDPAKPYDVTVEAENFRYTPENGPLLALGGVNAGGEIGLGRLLIKDGSIGTLSTGESITKASGSILLKTPGKYDLRFASVLHEPYLKELLAGLAISPRNMPQNVNMTSSLTGSYLQPEIGGDAEIGFGASALLPGREGCGIQSVKAGFELSTDHFVLHNFQIEDLSSGGELEVQLKGARNVRGSVSLALDRGKRWMKSCLLGENESGQVLGALGSAIADSQTDLTVGGTLTPLAIESQIESDISVKDRNLQTKLSATVGVDEKEFRVRLNEHGVVPQIQPVSDAASTGRSQTKFALAVNSNIQAELSYKRNSSELEVKKLQLVRYPVSRLLARLGPFLADETFQKLSAAATDQSLLDLVGSGTIDFDGLSSKLEGRLQATALSLMGAPVSAVTVPFTLKGKQLAIDSAQAELLAGRVRASLDADLGEPIGSKTISGNIQAEGLDLFAMPIFSDPALSERAALSRAVVNGGVRIGGAVGNPEYNGELRLEVTKPSAADATKLSVFKITGDASGESVQASLLDGAGDLQLTLPKRTAKNEPLKVMLSTRDLPLDYFFPTDPDSEDAPSEPSSLSGVVQYTGPRDDPLSGNGTVEITKLQLVQPGLHLSQSGNLLAEVRNGRLDFKNVRFNAEGKELLLSGSVDRQVGWRAGLHGAWDLGIFVVGLDALEQASGDVNLDLAINGPLFHPAISGPLTIKNASVSFPLGRTIVGVSDGALHGEFTGENFEISNISARMGGTDIKGSGEVTNVLSSTERRALLSVGFDDVVIEPVDHLTLVLAGMLSLAKAPLDPPVLSGQITVKSALYEDTIKLSQLIRGLTQSILGSSSLKEQGRRSTSDRKRPMQLDLQIKASDNVLVETNFAQAELRGDLRLTGDTKQPLLDGRIEAIDGVFGMQSNEFELISGQLTFSRLQNTLDPHVSLIGETSAVTRTGEEHHIQLLVGGTLTRPDVTFRSDGGLRREEIQALLGLGTNIEPLDFLKGGKRTRSIAELINPTSNVSIEERLEGLTKFSTVQIDTALSPTTGEFVPRLIAKRPLAKGLDLDIQSELAGNQISSMNVEYPLTPYLSLISGWRSSPATENVNKGSGTFSAGIHYRTTFPGLKLLSPTLSRTREEER